MYGEKYGITVMYFFIRLLILNERVPNKRFFSGFLNIIIIYERK